MTETTARPAVTVNTARMPPPARRRNLLPTSASTAQLISLLKSNARTKSGFVLYDQLAQPALQAPRDRTVAQALQA